MKCPTCGAENEAGNRFCEQCGSRIEPSGNFPQAQVVAASQPTAAGPTCPSCGAAVLPGEAFCDECGASLTGAAPTVLPGTSNDAPTMIAPPPPAANAVPAGEPTVICPACGQPNLATDRFCDHCGATLDAAPATASAPVAADAPTVMSDLDLLQSLNTAPAAIVEPDAVTVTPEPPVTPDVPVSPDNAKLAEAPTVEQPMITAASAGAQEAYEAEQKRLNEEIERQQKIIAQFEQMQTMFGAATPAAVTQGLTEARDALARVETDLAALQPPPPPAPTVDPAEVARLNEEIERQQKIIAQFEQMQAMFGAAAPAAVIQGLAEARDAQARAEAELAALTGGSAPATPATAAPTAPSEPQAQVAAIEAALNDVGTVPSAIVPPTPAAPVEPAVSAPVAPAIPVEPVAQVAPPSPRLVIDGGKDVTLPTDKREIIIGREDPISGIFPEVDLTPFGGETGGVSRQHARINHDAGQWTVTDLNSTNYTRVDGSKIEPNVAVPIKDGAQLQFGRVAMTFRE